MVALYLAHEVEEEEPRPRVELIREAFCRHDINQVSLKLFLWKKDNLWKSLQYRVIIQRKEAELVMRRVLPKNYIWRRRRSHDRILVINDRMVQERRVRRIQEIKKREKRLLAVQNREMIMKAARMFAVESSGVKRDMVQAIKC